VKDLGGDNLGMLPIYIGVDGEENQGLCTGSENFWCVNNNSSDADIQATLDFLYWCVTSEAGTSAMADKMGFVIPFKKAKDSTPGCRRPDPSRHCKPKCRSGRTQPSCPQTQPAAGYTQDDIKGFADLKKVADDIQARKAELGVDGAFTSAGMDSSSDWRFKTHLANLPIYYEYKADGISSTDVHQRAPTSTTTSRSGICTSPIPPAILPCWLPRPATTLWPSSWARRLSSIRTAPGLTMT